MIAPSKRDDYPFLADWFAISLRWLMLLAIPSTLLIAGTLNWNVIYLILFGTLWNIFSSLLALVNRRIPAHPEYISAQNVTGHDAITMHF